MTASRRTMNQTLSIVGLIYCVLCSLPRNKFFVFLFFLHTHIPYRYKKFIPGLKNRTQKTRLTPEADRAAVDRQQGAPPPPPSSYHGFPIVPPMILTLHLIDASFSPVHSCQTAIEPIVQQPAEHIVTLPVGRGNQTIKWLTLAATQRLQALHKTHGRVRHREPLLGSSASFIPSGVGRGKDKESLDPYMQLSDAFSDKDHVFIVFNQISALKSQIGGHLHFSGVVLLSTRKRRTCFPKTARRNRFLSLRTHLCSLSACSRPTRVDT